MKEFILINAPIYWESEKSNEDYLSPLGLGYIATYLENESINVEMLDSVKMHLSVSEIIAYIDNKNPDFIGINIFTQNCELVKYIVEKTEFDGIIFIGGQATKFLYNEILDWKTENECNIIIGEAELIIPKLCISSCLERPQIIYKNKKVFMVNKNSLYFPRDISSIHLDRKFLKDELVTNHYGELEASIITSRGCLFDCAFCGGARSLNKDVTPRTRTVESIQEEISELLSIYPNLQSIRILDDLFLRNKNSFELATTLFNDFANIHWRGMAHVHSIKSSMNKIQELYASGCRELFIGIESGSDSVRKKINKIGSCNDVLEVASAVLMKGIDLKGYFIFGFPGETKEDFEATYELAAKIRDFSEKTIGNFRTSVFQFRPYHGTKLYNEIVEKYGNINPCRPNQQINQVVGRTQFNFTSGNYSTVDDEILNEYIEKTQKL